jgi:hypothetical protein
MLQSVPVRSAKLRINLARRGIDFNEYSGWIVNRYKKTRAVSEEYLN